MPNYARAAATATRMLSAAGVPITLKKATIDDYDPSQGSAESLGSQVYSGHAVRDGSPIVRQYQQSVEANSAVVTENIKLFVSMPDAAPSVGDTISMDGVSWKVDGVDPIAPGPVAILYQVAVRRP